MDWIIPVRWGFPIVRTTYADDALFAELLETLQVGAYKCLDGVGRAEHHEHHLTWTVIEDPSSLNGASIDAIRACFIKWVDTYKDAENTEDIAKDPSSEICIRTRPRFNYCLVVDKTALEDFIQKKASGTTNSLRLILVERGWKPGKYRDFCRPEYNNGFWPHWDGGDQEDDDDDDNNKDEDDRIPLEEIDGCCEPIIGWMYVQQDMNASIYADIALAGEERGWYRAYRRPPRIYPWGEFEEAWKISW